MVSAPPLPQIMSAPAPGRDRVGRIGGILPAHDGVVAVAADERVGALVAPQEVAVVGAVQAVVALAAPDRVVAGAAEHRVVVLVAATESPPPSPSMMSSPAKPGDRVGPFGADEAVVAGRYRAGEVGVTVTLTVAVSVAPPEVTV